MDALDHIAVRLTGADVFSIAVVFGLDEVRQHFPVRPTARPVDVRPIIVVMTTASQILHVVDCTSTA